MRQFHTRHMPSWHVPSSPAAGPEAVHREQAPAASPPEGRRTPIVDDRTSGNLSPGPRAADGTAQRGRARSSSTSPARSGSATNPSQRRRLAPPCRHNLSSLLDDAAAAAAARAQATPCLASPVAMPLRAELQAGGGGGLRLPDIRSQVAAAAVERRRSPDLGPRFARQQLASSPTLGRALCFPKSLTRLAAELRADAAAGDQPLPQPQPQQPQPQQPQQPARRLQRSLPADFMQAWGMLQCSDTCARLVARRAQL
jgi:hypothetical protein